MGAEEASGKTVEIQEKQDYNKRQKRKTPQKLWKSRRNCHEEKEV